MSGIRELEPIDRVRLAPPGGAARDGTDTIAHRGSRPHSSEMSDGFDLTKLTDEELAKRHRESIALLELMKSRSAHVIEALQARHEETIRELQRRGML